jgi:hypothetical protein
MRKMVSVFADELASIYPNLLNLGFGFDMTGDDAVTVEESREVLAHIVRFCDRLKWTDISAQASRLLARAESGQRGDAMYVLAEDLREAFYGKLDAVQLLIIEDHDLELFEGAAKLLSGPLKPALSISEEELNLSGRALATGLSTAAVAHAMRSVEASLHALAVELEITFAAGPVQLQDWISLTEKIKSQITAWEKEPRGQKKTKELEWLAKLILPADAFRLAWRNHVAHAREKYESGEARTVLRHVGDYLKTLSAGL